MSVAGAAYSNSIARTVEFSEDIDVDLDAMGVVVGVELFDLMIPMDALASKYHIHSDAIRILAAAIQGQAATGTASSEATPPRPVPFRTVTHRKLTSIS